MDKDLTELLRQMAIILERQIVAIGGNPRDHTEVDAFINGCGISKKLKKLITDELDGE